MSIKVYSTYEASAYIAAVADNGIAFQITPPSLVAVTIPRLMGISRIRVVLATAVQSRLALFRVGNAPTPLAPGIFPGVLVSQGGGGYSGGAGTKGLLASVWTVAPTSTGNAIEQDLLPATIGAGFEWTWPEDNPFAGFTGSGTDGQGTGFCLKNLNGGAAVSGDIIVTVRWSEYTP